MIVAATLTPHRDAFEPGAQSPAFCDFSRLGLGSLWRSLRAATALSTSSPTSAPRGASSVRFLDNTAGTRTNSFLSADGAAGSVVGGITVSGNTVTGASLHTVIDLARRSNIVFTSNTSTVPAAGPVLRLAHIDDLTVTGNVQPLMSGILASITDCTGVTTQ